jgi:3-methyladenine DNA glycosylase AlkD
MPTLASVMAELQAKASTQTLKTYLRHGAPVGKTLGVSTAEMKLIAKSIKKQQTLALELYTTGIFDAMYLAGMVADGAKMTEAQLDAWAEAAPAPMISEHTVPWVAVESARPVGLAMRWIASGQENIATSGWCTYSGIVATTPDTKLDLAEIDGLLEDIPARIKTAPNRVRYTMNGFVISVGGYVPPLLQKATAVAKQLGKVAVDVGNTACEVPIATDYIAKMHARGNAGVKRKTIRC